MSSDNGKGGSVNANEQTIFQLIKDFRLAREADEAIKFRAREQRDGSSSGSGGRSSVIVASEEMLTFPLWKATDNGRWGRAAQAVGRSGVGRARGLAEVIQNRLMFLSPKCWDRPNCCIGHRGHGHILSKA